MSPTPQTRPIHLRLPATSANLGPGFDALGLAMSLYLTILATPAEDFLIEAIGRDAQLCSTIEDNLILTTYMDVLANVGVLAPNLHLKLHNEIPLGMGCGSSAAALLAGVLLANHFGSLDWTDQQILEEACRREGHPDNVAACYLGGMTASAITENSVVTATWGKNLNWNLLLAIPSGPLSTKKARALLPEHYSREDAVANIQSTALLVAAFAQNRPELLRAGMRDQLHQPYRSKACPLLPKLLHLMETQENSSILGVALSGAGPSVLLITANPAPPSVDDLIRQAAGDPNLEIIHTAISTGVLQT